MTSPNPQSAKTSVLAADLQIAGNVTSTGQVVFHAKITGDIVADELAIEAGAEVQGDVKARRLKIDGSVLGAVVAADVTITSIGRVSGAVSYGTLTVQAGATLDGELTKVRPASGTPQPSGSPTE